MDLGVQSLPAGPAEGWTEQRPERQLDERLNRLTGRQTAGLTESAPVVGDFVVGDSVVGDSVVGATVGVSELYCVKFVGRNVGECVGKIVGEPD